jgi:histidyl-tRNA synthetase
MKQADRSGARYAFIVGEQELMDGVVTVRNLVSGEETSLATAAAVSLAFERPASI